MLSILTEFTDKLFGLHTLKRYVRNVVTLLILLFSSYSFSQQSSEIIEHLSPAKIYISEGTIVANFSEYVSVKPSEKSAFKSYKTKAKKKIVQKQSPLAKKQYKKVAKPQQPAKLLIKQNKSEESFSAADRQTICGITMQKNHYCGQACIKENNYASQYSGDCGMLANFALYTKKANQVSLQTFSIRPPPFYS